MIQEGRLTQPKGVRHTKPTVGRRLSSFLIQLGNGQDPKCSTSRSLNSEIQLRPQTSFCTPSLHLNLGRVTLTSSSAFCPQRPFRGSPNRHFSNFSPQCPRFAQHQLVFRIFLSYQSLNFFSSAPGIQSIAGESYKTDSFSTVCQLTSTQCSHVSTWPGRAFFILSF